jgi:hypothetical protein
LPVAPPYDRAITEDSAGIWLGGPVASQSHKLPWLRPFRVPDRLSQADYPPFGQQFATPEHTPLNDGPPPARVPRFFDIGVRYNAGLRQWGSQQHFHQAWLPPVALTARALQTRVSARSIGGILGAGMSSAAQRHLPSVFVPRTIT